MVRKKSTEIKASDCKCVDCGKQAEIFWPVFDLDIRSYPYCRTCCEKQKQTLLFKLFIDSENKKEI